MFVKSLLATTLSTVFLLSATVHAKVRVTKADGSVTPRVEIVSEHGKLSNHSVENAFKVLWNITGALPATILFAPISGGESAFVGLNRKSKKESGDSLEQKIRAVVVNYEEGGGYLLIQGDETKQCSAFTEKIGLYKEKDDTGPARGIYTDDGHRLSRVGSVDVDGGVLSVSIDSDVLMGQSAAKNGDGNTCKFYFNGGFILDVKSQTVQ